MVDRKAVHLVDLMVVSLVAKWVVSKAEKLGIDLAVRLVDVMVAQKVVWWDSMMVELKAALMAVLKVELKVMKKVENSADQMAGQLVE